ncbi:MAG: hypothetical protein HOW73_34400 [Polyangiaceae bacterium]|nr:hypothetical protein [Polyangiaceae bacterium]
MKYLSSSTRGIAGTILLALGVVATACGDDTTTGGGGEGASGGADTGGGGTGNNGGAPDGGSDPNGGGGEGGNPPNEVCGDGMVGDAEACDGADLDGHTCETEGFAGGQLGCTDQCELDTSQCQSEPECGNAVVEGDELCDGAALGGETCASLGFAGGMLACAIDCTDFDTSQCTDCGNMVIDGAEECDETNLNGEDCLSLGFDEGELGCAANCTFDTSSCAFETCGNNTLDPNEPCDGTLLGGATCMTQGFDAGMLTCSANCTLDTSACTTCGDAVAEGTEDCDGADLAGETCASQGFMSGSLACSASCAFDTSACSTLPAPGAGALVITEIMQNPTGTDTTVGEWFEIHNPSSTTTFQLAGCVVEGAAAESFTITGDLQIPPLGFLTFSNVAAPGFTPSYVYPGSFALTNGADTVRLVCENGLVDEVLYDGGPLFPDPDGESMNLSVGLDATANDNGGNWCQATITSPNFTTGDLGTPGFANTACPIDYAIGFCRLQFPTSLTQAEGTTATVYGRVYAAGLTDQTTSNDPSPNLLGAVGYGPDGSDPAMGGWTWTAAIPNPAWNGTTFGEPNNDEYQAALVVPPSAGSPYDYAYRFSGDGGTTWTYCDSLAPGSSDGYQTANAGNLVSQPGVGPANIWINEIHYDNTGGDVDEGIEIAGVAGTDLTGYSLVFYNGQGNPVGQSYLTIALTGTIPNQSNGFGTLWFAAAGMQNGPTDGVALVSPANSVMYFLCYEGTFTATNGAANGQTCVDVGVLEVGTEAIGLSLQLIGTGGGYASFTWAGPVAHSRGMTNAGQTLQ